MQFYAPVCQWLYLAISTHIHYCAHVCIIRSPDIHVGELIFHSEFFLFLLFRRLISEVPERNWTKIGHMFGSKCGLKTHDQNLGYPLPLQISGPKTLLGRLRNITATLTAYIFGTKCDVDNRSSALTTTRGLLHRNGFKLVSHFYPPYVNSAFYVIAKRRRRTPANGIQPHFVTRRMVNRASNLL